MANEDLIRLAALGTFPKGEGFWMYHAKMKLPLQFILKGL